MMAMMLMQCPTCGTSFDLAAREQPYGMTGGSFCPQCHERFAIPGPTKTVAIASLIIALGTLALAGVRSSVGLVVGAALLWVPISLFLNVARCAEKALSSVSGSLGVGRSLSGSTNATRFAPQKCLTMTRRIFNFRVLAFIHPKSKFPIPARLPSNHLDYRTHYRNLSL
jgi:hypothetical protein